MSESQAGKGDRRRLMRIDRETFYRNYERTFGPAPEREPEPRRELKPRRKPRSR